MFTLFLLALLGSIIALAGGVIFLYNRKLSHTLEINSVPFAAGVLITTSLIGLAPESVDLIGESTFIIILITFFIAYLFEHLFFGLHHHDPRQHGQDYQSAIPLVIFGDTIHNFIDGIAIGASFFLSPGLGLVTAISTFLHEVPHEIGDFGILLAAGWRRRHIIIVNVLSASTTFLGAFSLLLFSSNETFIGLFLAISAGIFLYLGASDFLPKIDDIKGNRLQAILPLIIGVAAMAITLMVIPHGH